MYNKLSVCIVGLGYIGLPTAALLANKGYWVHGVDINDTVVKTINRGGIHIVEPDLNEYVKLAVSSGRLKASTSPIASDIYIIAVPTPFKKDYEPDISFIENAVHSILPYIKNGDSVILESTSPVGTTNTVSQMIEDFGINLDNIYVAYCPERVLPGKIMKELTENDRIVGGINQKSTLKVKEFYESFITGNVLGTDSRTAEMCKLIENAYRDVNIAFANELSLICSTASVNVNELIKLANHHPRVNILQPGVGVGGHCIAVDPWFLVSSYPNESKLIKQARLVNENKTSWVIQQIRKHASYFFDTHKRKPVIACMGLSFKPDIDDLRESPAIMVVERLIEDNYELLLVEPNISSHPSLNLTDYSLAINTADIICFLVKHKEFISLDIDWQGKIALDFCGINLFDKV